MTLGSGTVPNGSKSTSPALAGFGDADELGYVTVAVLPFNAGHPLRGQRLPNHTVDLRSDGLRHAQGKNLLFCDGHVECGKSNRWYAGAWWYSNWFYP